jgi:hypothetical protein
MKNTLIILSILLLSSCYTKNQALKKFCKTDTTQYTIYLHDTIFTDSVQIDTVFSENIDSVYITQDKIEIQYVKKYGKIYLQGKCKSDTIYFTKIVTLKVPTNCPKLVWYKQYAADYWWLWPLLISMYFGIAYFHKIMNRQ